MVETFDLELGPQGDVSTEGGGCLVIDLPAGVEETEVGVGGLEIERDGLDGGEEEVVDDETDVEGQVEKGWHVSLAE